MSFEKPWEKPFRALLEEFAGYCGGVIKEPDFADGDSFRAGSLYYYAYPSLDTTFGSVTIRIEITGSPTGGIRHSKGSDEYVRILIATPTRYNITVKMEHLLRKYLKMLGVELEFQTGNSDFDKRYFVEVSSETDKGFMRLSSTQGYIRQLEPFDAVEILPEGIRWAQEIRRKSQLKYAALQQHVQHLVTFAKAISTSD